LYAGAFLQLTTGRIGWSGLCSFIRPFIVAAGGFRFTYLHFECLGMRAVLWFMVFLTWFWKRLVKLTEFVYMDRFSLMFPISNVHGNPCYGNRTNAMRQTDTMEQIVAFC